ncbi:dTDP-glucose 4,6-dehydratase [bacterium]|nr:dTDP-glucose 4,6-dehydratase [bacterium]MCB2179270.1 dTDP-glucose 4,6-dehydratase [bacterium]
MKNVLVTGGAGFIGSNFVHYLLEQEPDVRVVNLDLLTYAGNKANLEDLPHAENHIFVQGDIRDVDLVNRLFAEYDLDTVVHFAAESHVDRSIHGPAAFVETNIIGTFVLLEAAKKYWADDKAGKRFHHVSTDEVFGSLGPDDPPFDEHTAYDPRSPYSASKASSDHLVSAYAHTYGLPVTVTNCTNNYGPYQYPEKLIPVIITNCLEGKPIPVYGDGKQIRDWLYVDDHCDAIYRVLKNGRDGETYAIGGNNQPTNLEIIHTICQVLDDRLPQSPHVPHKDLITFVTDRPGHDRRYAMSIEHIQSELGWQPTENLTTGLEKTVDWYLANLDWVNDIRSEPLYADWMDQNYGAR